MKRIRNMILAATLGVTLLIGPAVIVTGCKTNPTTQMTALKTLSSSHILVDSGLAGYYSLVLDGKISTNSVPQISRGYREYQIAYNAAVLIVAGNTNAPAPASVIDAQNKFLSDVTVAKSHTTP